MPYEMYGRLHRHLSYRLQKTAAVEVKKLSRWSLDLEKDAPRRTILSSSEEQESSLEELDSSLEEEENGHPHATYVPELKESSTAVDETLISKLNVLWEKDGSHSNKKMRKSDGVEGCGSNLRQGPMTMFGINREPRTMSEVEGDRGGDQTNCARPRLTASEEGENSQTDDTHSGLLVSIGNSPLRVKRKWNEEEYSARNDCRRGPRAFSVVKGDQGGEQNNGVKSALTASDLEECSQMNDAHSRLLQSTRISPPMKRKWQGEEHRSAGSDSHRGPRTAFVVDGDKGDDQKNGAQSEVTAAEVGENSHMNNTCSDWLQSIDYSHKKRRDMWNGEEFQAVGSDSRRRPRTVFVIEGDQGGDQKSGAQSELTTSEVGGNSHIDCTRSGSPALRDHSPLRKRKWPGADYTVGCDPQPGKMKTLIVEADQGGNENNGARTMVPNQDSLHRSRSSP